MNINWADLGEISSVIGGASYGLFKFYKEYKRNNSKKTEKILQEAKSYSDTIKSDLEVKITLLEVEIRTLEDNFKKDIEHVKEIQANEIKNLAEKIELLRDDLRNQHSSILELLTKIVDKY